MAGFAMLVAGCVPPSPSSPPPSTNPKHQANPTPIRTSPGVRYAGTFLGALGIYPCVANTIVWTSNNTEGVYKRGITMGFVIGWGNLNGVVSSNIYQATDAPLYRRGHGIVLAYLTVFLLGGSLLQYWSLRRENAKRRAGRRDHWADGKTEEEVQALGDMRPDFFYTL